MNTPPLHKLSLAPPPVSGAVYDPSTLFPDPDRGRRLMPEGEDTGDGFGNQLFYEVTWTKPRQPRKFESIVLKHKWKVLVRAFPEGRDVAFVMDAYTVDAGGLVKEGEQGEDEIEDDTKVKRGTFKEMKE